jgi:hypothetical protein
VKLLLDENLSHRILKFVSDLYPDSASVDELNLYAAKDEEIWRLARWVRHRHQRLGFSATEFRKRHFPESDLGSNR